MYTDPTHIHVNDPGHLEGNVVFAYLDAFYPDKAELAQLKMRYQAGGVGDNALKKLLEDTLQKLLEPMRERRAAISTEAAMDLVKAGTQKMRSIAQQTMQEVREAIGIAY